MTKRQNKKLKQEQEEQDLTMTENQVEIGRIRFSFSITRAEAEQYTKKPKGQIARNLRKYMISILEEGVKQFMKSPKEDTPNVTECKDIEK